MDGIPILDNLTEINPNWITRVLNAQPELAGCQVVDMTREDLNQEVGFASQLVRVRMHYGERPDGAPGSIIVKMAPSNAETREFGTLLGLFQREVAFYKYLAADNPCNPPKCYLAQIADSGDKFTLVVEDLGSHDPEKILEGASPEEAHAVMTALGGLHAKYWKGRNLDGHDWIPSLATMTPALSAMAGGAVPGFFDRFGDRVPEHLRGAMEQALSAYGELLAFVGENGLQTLCHMDAHLGNILFQDGRPRFFDWQAYFKMSYSYDVAYFLNGNLTVKTRQQHQAALLETYANALHEGGVDEVSLEDITAAYHRESAGQLVGIPLIAGAFLTDDERGNTMANAWLPRIFAAMDDSDAPKQLADLLAEARA